MLLIVYKPARHGFPGSIFQRCSYLIFNPHSIYLTVHVPGITAIKPESLPLCFRAYQPYNWISSTLFCKIITKARTGCWDTPLPKSAPRFPGNTYHSVGQYIPHPPSHCRRAVIHFPHQRQLLGTGLRSGRMARKVFHPDRWSINSWKGTWPPSWKFMKHIAFVLAYRHRYFNRDAIVDTNLEKLRSHFSNIHRVWKRCWQISSGSFKSA